MIITLAHNSYTITDVAISNISYRHNKSIYCLLASLIIWLLFVPHTEVLDGLLCVTRIAIPAITIASGVILADLEDEIIGRVIQFVFSLSLEKATF